MVTQSVLNSLEVFERVASLQPTRLNELSSALALPKSTVQRHLRTLEQAGWLAASDDDYPRWEVAPRLRWLLVRDRQTNDVRNVARPTLERLSNELREDVQLTVPSTRNQIVTVDRIAHEEATVTSAPIGTAMSRFETTGGIAMLARNADEVIEQLLAREEASSLVHSRVLESVRATRSLGYSTRVDESRGVVYLSATLLDARDEVAGAVTVGIPIGADIDGVGATLVQAARDVSAALNSSLAS